MTYPPMRIALVQTQAENAGAQEISRILAQGLEARGHEITQIFFFRRTRSFDAVPNVRIVCSERPSSPAALASFLFRLRATLRDARPDAVLTFQHYGNVIAAPVARSLGLRVVVANQVSASDTFSAPVRWMDALLGMVGAYSRIVINSVETEAMYRGYWRSYAQRILRIDHGFEDKTKLLTRTEARAGLGLPPDITLLGCASRLSPMKNLDAAIRTVALRPALHLALAGQGNDRGRLERLAAALGVTDRVHFVGELDPSEVGVFLAGLDVFLHPSRSETFGLAPVEAAQAGVPVLCNELEVLRDVLQVGGEPCAIFADADDPEAFASAVDRIISEPSLAANLRGAGRRLVERYPVDAMVDQYEALIGCLVGKGEPCASPSSSTPAPSVAGRTWFGIG